MIMDKNYKKNKYTHRLIARIVIKAETPLAVSSGEKDVVTDALIVRDMNGLPYIPGTAIAGVIRHALGEEKSKTFFGYSAEDDIDKSGKGSEIIFSSAYLVDKDRQVAEGLISDESKSDYLKFFDELPVRQHVAIDGKGVNKQTGKFDEEVVYKGTHFCFEIEMLSDGSNEADFEAVLNELASDTFRIGSGTRKGFGRISIVECKKAILDLTDEVKRKEYLNKTSSLNDETFWADKPDLTPTIKDDDWIKYELRLKPDDFFLFGSGFGDGDADMTPVSETSIKWNFEKGEAPEFQHKYILIPATSVKGAISHRVTFYYNKLNGYTIKESNGKYETDINAKVGVKNNAIKALFGYTLENENESKRGNVIFSDLIEDEYKTDKTQLKLLNHVAIDRFTGGAMDGALFSEKTVYGGGQEYKLEILVNKNAFKVEPNDRNGQARSQDDIDKESDDKKKIKQALESAFNDITTGMLPLGGGVNRGHGCFSGSLTIKE
ncbi:MAG: RAMP superfamily CRISPR-associated protein [Dysgonamonadaceae bacterium]|jgi:CRISPR/Cas system CSM-associated protein Csm3 (group 7 of RAMP superfamily)|nr:RAMP superfamily CRISPR-associated protein [Dysgonamonadaceae bacterium]